MLEVTIAPGQTLWEALAEHGIQLTRPCGGRGICGGCKVYVDGLGEVQACKFDRPGIYRVETSGDVHYDIVMNPGESAGKSGRAGSLEGSQTMISGKGSFGSQSNRGVYIVVDIGTTTVALSGFCGEKTAQEGFLNPQRSFGTDVVSRIAAANVGQGEEMCAMLMEPLMEALERMRARLNRDCVRCTVILAANTTMLHVLRGFSCEGLGEAPFAPVDLKEGRDTWKGMRAEFDIYYMPGISAYVGADIVSGIYGLGMMERQEVTMLLDLGTNGEMAIGNCNRLLCASAAAGPAFEGSPLAMQIHASGILKCLHKLRKCGIIDEYGLLDEEYFEDGYPLGSRLRITQDDIREIQMAKGAVRAGIEILLKEYGLEAKQVSRVYLAGGMGYYIDPADAAGIGLIPAEFAGKTEAVGNSCLTGLLRAAHMLDSRPEAAGRTGTISAHNKPDKSVSLMDQIADSAEEIILANHPDFEELYIAGMNFI